LEHQLDSGADIELLLLAAIEQVLSFDILHSDVRIARFGRPSIDNPGDVWVLHASEHLLLALKTSDDLLVFSVPSDQFQSDLPVDWGGLLRKIDIAHTPDTDFCFEFKRADLLARQILKELQGVLDQTERLIHPVSSLVAVDQFA
jgi:hypothetical protein